MSDYEERSRKKFIGELDKLIQEEESFMHHREQLLIEAVKADNYKGDYVTNLALSVREKFHMIKGLNQTKERILNQKT